MLLIQVIIAFSSFVVFANSAQTRLLVSCDKNGFSCKTIESKRLVVYQCPAKTQDIIVYLWNYGEPSNTAWVTIKNCEDVEIDLSCTSYRRPFETLTIENVTNLRFTRSLSTMKNPSKIVFKSIANIPLIPENTFTIPHMVKYSGVPQEHELQEIEFDNVSIGTIESHGFHSLRGFRNFTWNNVKVEHLHAMAINIVFNTTQRYQGNFSMANSTLTLMDYLSFQFRVKEATFNNNKFVEIMPGGISGTIETFNYFNNVIDVLQAGSISVLSKTVNILGNSFNYLKAGGLSKISPGLLVDSHTSFGNLEFTYKFSNNNVVYTDAGSLNPDMVAYDKVSTKFFFTFNNFLCTCENLGWLVSSVGHGLSSKPLEHFYETVTDDVASNICSGLSCRKTIASLKHFVKNGQCISDSTMENLCQIITTTPTPTFELVSEYIPESERWYNKSEMIKSGISITNIPYCYVIITSVLLNILSMNFCL